MLARMEHDPQRVFETWRDLLDVAGLADRLTLDESGLLRLDLSNTLVRDLSLIEGMPLMSLNLANTKVTHLGPLGRMPLEELRLDGCERLTDLGPLAECRSLERLIVPAHCASFDPLRELPALGRLSTVFPAEGWEGVTTAESFWQDHPSP